MEATWNFTVCSEIEPPGNVLVGRPLGHHAEHFQFPCREGRSLAHGLSRSGRGKQGIEFVRVDHRLSARHRFHRGEDLRGRCVARKRGAHTQSNCLRRPDRLRFPVRSTMAAARPSAGASSSRGSAESTTSGRRSSVAERSGNEPTTVMFGSAAARVSSPARKTAEGAAINSRITPPPPRRSSLTNVSRTRREPNGKPRTKRRGSTSGPESSASFRSSSE